MITTDVCLPSTNDTPEITALVQAVSDFLTNTDAVMVEIKGSKGSEEVNIKINAK